LSDSTAKRQNFAILAHFCKKNFAILAHFYEKDFAERKKGCGKFQ
jgi:hypothetical protein